MNPSLEAMLYLLETRLQNERGLMAIFSLCKNNMEVEKHRYAAHLLEVIRKDVESLKDANFES